MTTVFIEILNMMDMNNKTYLCGKVTGLPWTQVKAKFKRLENKAFRKGLDPVNPIIQSDKNATWEQEMKRCIALMCGCDHMMVASDWQRSEGAKLEVELAKKLGINIIFD